MSGLVSWLWLISKLKWSFLLKSGLRFQFLQLQNQKSSICLKVQESTGLRIFNGVMFSVEQIKVGLFLKSSRRGNHGAQSSSSEEPWGGRTRLFPHHDSVYFFFYFLILDLLESLGKDERSNLAEGATQKWNAAGDDCLPEGVMKAPEAAAPPQSQVWNIRVTLPSHVCVLHRASSVWSPMQMSPPLEGAGLLQVRVRW